MAHRYKFECTAVNHAYSEGRKMWKWFIDFLVFIIILKVIS